MSGDMKWVKHTPNPSPQSTLYSELSPAVLVGFTARGGPAVDYVKFSTVTAVMSETPNTITLRYGKASQVSLITASTEEFIRWLDAIHLALTRSKDCLSLAARSVPVTREHGQQPAPTLANRVAALPPTGAQKMFLDTVNNTNKERDSRHSVLVTDDTLTTSHLKGDVETAVRESDEVDATHSAGGALSSDARPRFSGVFLAEEKEQTRHSPMNEGVTSLHWSPKLVVEPAVLCQSKKLSLKPLHLDDVSFLGKVNGSALLGDGALTGEKRDSFAHNDAVNQLGWSCPPQEHSQTTPREVTETRRPSFAGHADPRAVDDFWPEPPLEPSPVIATGRGEVFDSSLSRKTKNSFFCQPALMSETEEKATDRDGLLRPHVDIVLKSDSVKSPIMAPALCELLCSDQGGLASSPESMTGHKPHFGHSSNLEWTVVGEGELASREGLFDSEKRRLNGSSQDMPWGSSLKKPTLLLDGHTQTQASPGVECGSQERNNNASNSRGCDANHRVLAESIIDRIIGATPSSGPHESLSPVLFLPGTDTPPSRLPTWERDNFYRPIEAVVAAIPRRSTSRCRSGVGRSVSSEGDWQRTFCEHCGARDVDSLRMQNAGSSAQHKQSPL